MTWSERAILWKGIAKPTAESMDLRKTIVLDRRDLDARDARIASLEATNASLRAKHADETARTKAHLTAEIETLAALVASRDARMEEHEGGNKRLARSDRYHNGPHSPSSTNSWSSERHKEAAARKNARQARRGRPGGGAGHPGVTRKMDTSMPVERRRAARCGRCGGDEALYEWDTEVKQCAELMNIETMRRTMSFIDVFCGGCGAKTAASRAGAVRGTSLGPCALALLWVIWSETHCSAATLADTARILLGIRMSRAGARPGGPQGPRRRPGRPRRRRRKRQGPRRRQLRPGRPRRRRRKRQGPRRPGQGPRRRKRQGPRRPGQGPRRNWRRRALLTPSATHPGGGRSHESPQEAGIRAARPATAHAAPVATPDDPGPRTAGGRGPR